MITKGRDEKFGPEKPRNRGDREIGGREIGGSDCNIKYYILINE